MLLQHDNARSHTSAVTSAAIESIKFEIVPHLPCSPDLAQPDSRNISKKFVSLVMKKFKLLQENGFWSSLKSSTATDWKDLVKAGGTVSNERETTGKLRYRNKVHTLSYNCILFHFNILVWSKDTSMEAKSAFFWDITQRRLVILYRSLGTTYQSHLQRRHITFRTPFIAHIAIQQTEARRVFLAVDIAILFPW
jgi:hypothetical protein